MTHWRKSSGDPESAFNSYLAGWAIAASVMLATRAAINAMDAFGRLAELRLSRKGANINRTDKTLGSHTVARPAFYLPRVPESYKKRIFH